MGEDEVVDESFCDLQRTKLNQSFETGYSST